MAPEHCPLVSGDHPSGGSHPRRGVPGREGQDPEGPVARLCVFGTQGPRRHCRSGREDGAAPVGQASSPAPWPLRLLLPPFLARGAGHQGPQQGPEGRGSGQHTQGPGRREPRWREAGGAHRLPHAHAGLPRALGLSQDRRQPGPGSQWPRHLPRRPARGLQPAVSRFGAVRACPRLCRPLAKRGLGMRPGRHPTVLTALPA